MGWNITSDLLFIYYIQNDKHFLEIWNRSNYYWYLKYQHIFDENIIDIQWDIINTYLLHILLPVLLLYFQYEYKTFSYCWDVNSFVIKNKDNLIGVINGSQLKLTNFDVYKKIYQENIIPPPFSQYEINLTSPILSFVICDEYIILYLSNNSINILKKNNNNYEENINIKLDDKYNKKLRQMIIVDNSTIAMILSENLKDNVLTIKFNNSIFILYRF